MKKWISIIILLALSAPAFVFGRNICFAEQWHAFDGLRQTASIIFGVFGVWLAIVYRDDIVSRLVGVSAKNDDGQKAIKKAEEDIDAFECVFNGVIYSSVIIAVILVIGLIAPVIRQVGWFCKYAWIIRACSFYFLMVLTVAQLYVILMSLSPMVSAREKVLKALGIINIIRK